MKPIPASPEYRRGQIWMVDFGNPVGQEFGYEHPSVIVSNSALSYMGRLIVVPGTSTRTERPGTGELIKTHQEVPATALNGLLHTTYFMAENVRSLSVARFRRCTGMLETSLLNGLEDRLCLIMELFRRS